tara:strand:- start:598 stop:852 length:255 start_codon:yes stop_codon:yes gene_type:complete
MDYLIVVQVFPILNPGETKFEMFKRAFLQAGEIIKTKSLRSSSFNQINNFIIGATESNPRADVYFVDVENTTFRAKSKNVEGRQ